MNLVAKRLRPGTSLPRWGRLVQPFGHFAVLRHDRILIPRSLLRKAQQQLSFDFGQRKRVERPGSRGGRYWVTDKGEIRYGARPAVAARSQTPSSVTVGRQSPLKQVREQILSSEKAPEEVKGTASLKKEKRPADARVAGGFKNYSDDWKRDGVEHWEVSQEDYIRYQTFHQKRRAAKYVEGWRHYIESYGGVVRGTDVEWKSKKLPKQKRNQAQVSYQYYLRAQANVESGEWPTSGQVDGWRNEYIKLVKQALSKGKPVPAAVIAQRPEFRKALTARQRYEKGRHTSFANESVAVNRTMQWERGFKVKRQDGKPITQAQINEITQGVDELESIVGPLKDILQWSSVTIAHTSGKHPFLRAAGGLYSSGERTVSIGVSDLMGKPIASMAHELLGHFVDFEAGRALGLEMKTYPTSSWGRVGRARIVTSLAEVERRKGEGGTELIREATRKINNTYSIRTLSRRKKNALASKEQKNEVERMKVSLGPYWREPCEVFARLVEQYVSSELGRGGVSAEADYTSRPGWWTAEDFEAMKPRVRAEIDRRLKIIHDAIAAGRAAMAKALILRAAAARKPRVLLRIARDRRPHLAAVG